MDQTQLAFREYLAFEKKYSAHTVNGYAKDLEFFAAFLKKEFDEVDLLVVHYSQIRNWIVQLVDQGISNAAVNRKISSLKAYYKFLLKCKLIESSPLLKHKSLKTPKIIQIPFSEQELEQVLNGLVFPEGFEGIRDKLIIDLFYTTGIRRAELIELKLSSFDGTYRNLKVLGKRNKERIVPIHPLLISQIELYMQARRGLKNIADKDCFFLTIKGVKISESFVYSIINHYFSHVSEKVKRSPHILRHTFATHLLNNGADINSVKELLGHSSLASTQVYTHSSLSELKKIYSSSHPRNLK
ncbi:MAG: integrase [Flavobacterium sp.]|nr:integrase [Flavobacterium sp.]